jgi:hypothetical protein
LDTELPEIEKVIQEVSGKQVDDTSKASIAPLVAYINNINN